MDDREPGIVEDLLPGLKRILAPNPSPMTYTGTNTFIVGETDVAVVDPGPDDPAHLAALRSAAPGTITTILVTHPHLDHSPGATALSRLTGAPVLAYGRANDGLSARMADLGARGIGGGEGVDRSFKPDGTLRDGDRIDGDGWSLDVVETPGHFAGHLAFRGDGWMLSGDHVMAWASTLISPPHGDVSDFLATSEKLIRMAPGRMFPAHGPEIADPEERLDWLIRHRREREDALLDALGPKPRSLEALTRAVYTDIDVRMLPAAARNLFAHLVDLQGRNLVVAEPHLAPEAHFRRP